ncbi:membrane protease subunit, stomatin/prohibitin [Rivularia sp. PCC 7116]|uniref:prohibitin family protein n=1 Tax=Rivularia sp. PCC 7116 TaxID=373994 RepID=UPI00029F172B|nr:prohibitin family protein [Rivularia sp. PCC 7116]AFY54481.1 membrane protease subunit, stomatin/prohibitin [Rivularia sp. PCC 7116]
MSFIISLLATLIATLVYLNSGKVDDERNRLAIRAVAALIGIVATIASISRALVIVPPGNIGVANLFGRVSDKSLNPGVNLVNPFTKTRNFSTRLKDILENVDASSQEGLNLNLDVSLQYKLDPQKAATVYKTIGTSETQLVISRFRSTIRSIVAQYPANAIYSIKRQEVARRINEQLTKELLPLGFVVEEALLRNVKMPDTIQQAIQEKLKAEQENQRMKFVLEKQRQEAERKRIEAKGIADAQKIISDGLTNQVLQLRRIEATEKLAQSPNSKIIMIGDGKGGMPILLQESANTKP